MGDAPLHCPVLTVTKSELRQILGCNSYNRWRGKVMTDEVLEEVLHCDRHQFNKLREFSVSQTRALANFFKPQFEQHFTK